MVCALLCALAGRAGADGIQATVDRTEATVEDQLVLSVTIEGTQSAQPVLPDLPAFDVYSRGQSRQYTSVNGRATSSITYTYILSPKRPGTFAIGAASVEIDGTTYRSQPFQVRILEASAQPQESRDLFTRATVSTTTPFVGEQVVYTWRFFRRVRIGDARLQPQDFSGVLIEDLGDVREYQTVVGGQSYFVSELRKALFPQEAGKIEVPGSQLSCQVEVQRQRRGRSPLDDFFRNPATEAKVLRTDPIEMTVRPLPPAPQGFSGLVGDFDLKADISKRDLRVGESTTLKVTVSGVGNPQLITEPTLPDLSKFKVYDDKPTSAVNRSGNQLSGTKTFSKALVPLAAGDVTLPGFELTFFDPQEGKYRTERTPDVTLHVAPSDGTEELRLTEALAPSAGKVAVRILADDVLPLHEGDGVLDSSWGSAQSSPWLLAGLALPPVLFLVFSLFQRRRLAFARDSSLRRRREALREAQKCLAGLDPGNAAEAARQASRCLRRYIGDKLGIEGAALTPGEADQLLRQVQVDEETVAETHRLLERLEAAQYGAGAVDAGRLQAEVQPLLQRLERQVKS
ncbi:MAG: protein BatD [Acidobacteria bacterium]|nr:protein BatD [Acidobacteriota bacterium]